MVNLRCRMKWIWLNQSTALWYDIFEPEGNAGELARIYRRAWPHGRITRGAGLVLFPQTMTFGRLTKRASEESDAPIGVVVENRAHDRLDGQTNTAALSGCLKLADENEHGPVGEGIARSRQAEASVQRHNVRVRQILSLLTPCRAVGMSKVRIACDNDGGYVMLDDFACSRAFYSFGIGADVSWDSEMARRGLTIFNMGTLRLPSPGRARSNWCG
jgi:hypothetical protein